MILRIDDVIAASKSAGGGGPPGPPGWAEWAEWAEWTCKLKETHSPFPLFYFF